ncbi:hypothetical protein GIB67_029245 [Kingdonia uniflora]|uniref:Peptidase S8/S53 domain-containing protein n=1 Tax=Kingdonia uniflora TaxID=39325 RepID=A0A7J7N8E6_9MAGN|nr:hypothetical protein GIB67_029245 [Kingdonia uniflora]
MGEIPRRWKEMYEPGIQFKSLMYNRKLIEARYFNKGVLAQDPNISFVYNSPMDETGNGTHTTSIAAGNYVRGASYFGYAKGTARGIVPCVRLAVYKVTWSRGGSLTYDIIAGTLTLGNGKTIIGWSLFLRRALPNASLVYNETLTGCNLPALLSESTNNAIVVCFEGPRINNQISTVTESTITGAIFISTEEREEYRIPRVTIKLIDAPIVINYAKSTIDPKATIKLRQTFVGRGEKCAPQILEYSSRGPSQNYHGVQKPDVVTPGS